MAGTMLFPITLQQPGEIALGTLDLGAVQQEWGDARRNRSVDDHPLTIAGKTYATGLGTHASSSLDVRVDGNALRFRAVVGVDDEATNNASIRFLVYADNKVKFDSGTMRKGQAKNVDVDLTGAKSVRFVVTDAGAELPVTPPTAGPIAILPAGDGTALHEDAVAAAGGTVAALGQDTAGLVWLDPRDPSGPDPRPPTNRRTETRPTRHPRQPSRSGGRWG